MPTNPEKNFGLTPVAFERLAERLRQGDETLFEKTFLSHFKICLDYLKSEDQATHDQAYDASMEALLTFRHGIAEGRINYGNLRYLLTRMTRQHFYKAAKRRVPSVPLGEEHDSLIEDSTEFDSDTLALLEAAWETLEAKCQVLLRKIFFLGQTIISIATEENLKPATLRKRKQRCLGALRKGYLNSDR